MRSSVVALKEGGSTPGCACTLLSSLPGIPQGSAGANTAEGASFPSLLFRWWLQALTEQREDISPRITLLSTLEVQSRAAPHPSWFRASLGRTALGKLGGVGLLETSNSQLSCSPELPGTPGPSRSRHCLSCCAFLPGVLDVFGNKLFPLFRLPPTASAP